MARPRRDTDFDDVFEDEFDDEDELGLDDDRLADGAEEFDDDLALARDVCV